MQDSLFSSECMFLFQQTKYMNICMVNTSQQICNFLPHVTLVIGCKATVMQLTVIAFSLITPFMFASYDIKCEGHFERQFAHNHDYP